MRAFSSLFRLTAYVTLASRRNRAPPVLKTPSLAQVHLVEREHEEAGDFPDLRQVLVCCW